MANEDQAKPTDAEVRDDPGEFTVEQILDVFSRSTPDQVAEVQALEADGKARATVAAFQAQVPVDDGPRFDRERVLSLDEGPRIAGASHSQIVGALHGDDAKDFSQVELQQKIQNFLGRTEDGRTEHGEAV